MLPNDFFQALSDDQLFDLKDRERLLRDRWKKSNMIDGFPNIAYLNSHDIHVIEALDYIGYEGLHGMLDSRQPDSAIRQYVAVFGLCVSALLNLELRCLKLPTISATVLWEKEDKKVFFLEAHIVEAHCKSPQDSKFEKLFFDVMFAMDRSDYHPIVQIITGNQPDYLEWRAESIDLDTDAPLLWLDVKKCMKIPKQLVKRMESLDDYDRELFLKSMGIDIYKVIVESNWEWLEQKLTHAENLFLQVFGKNYVRRREHQFVTYGYPFS